MPRLIDQKWRVHQPDGPAPYLVTTTEEPIPLESVAYVGAESVQVFRKYRTPEEVRQITFLVAAAPELLAAMDDCITNENCTAIATCDVAYMIRRFKAINEICRDAIAKAEGKAVKS